MGIQHGVNTANAGFHIHMIPVTVSVHLLSRLLFSLKYIASHALKHEIVTIFIQ